jgi:hypothetical protein
LYFFKYPSCGEIKFAAQNSVQVLLYWTARVDRDKIGCQFNVKQEPKLRSHDDSWCRIPLSDVTDSFSSSFAKEKKKTLRVQRNCFRDGFHAPN